ncbi:MAG: alpha-amylase family glycosyl hydrolase, partial [Methanococcaceae archaeon]
MEKLFNCFASFLNVHFFLFITITTIFTLPQRNITAQVAPGDPAAVPVEFRFFHNLAPTDSGVGINGTMNGWKEVYKMKQVQPGLWKAILELLPVSYDYKFVTYRDTTSQTGVTGYFTDPLNSLSGGPFGNSILKVKSPFIYYFLPVDQSEVNIDMPEISAKIAVANSAQLDLNKLVFKIDGIIIPNAMNYFNDVTKDFSYKPEEPLSMDTHTAYLKAFTTSGDSSELTISFTLRGHASVAPFTFQFDSKSPNFNFLSPVEKVDIKSTFNKEGMNSMSDADSDGVYTYTTNLRYNLPVEYTYIINGGAYINDPDNPLLSSKHRSMIIKTKNLNSYFTGFSPATARIYTLPKETFTIKGHINAADSAQIFNVSSLKANLDGTSIPVKIIRNNTDVDFEVTVTNPTEGRHIINFSGADIYGTQTLPFSYVFAVYPAGKGFHYIDGEKDDKGTGTFKYPATIADGCADIREVNITPTSGLDSLRFSIKMRKISENTRLGLVIINKLDASYVEAPKDVNIKIPEWNNRGVLALVGTQSPLLDKSENVIYGSRLPSMNFIDTISPDLPYLQQNEFRFTIAISVLENIMGTFKEKWYFGLYSYLKDQNGTVKVTADLGGKDIPENPNLYDLAFFNDQNIQFRLLSNFSSSSQIGGPALSVIGSDQRGFLAISPAEIDPQLGQAPAIKLLAGGGELLRDTVTIAGLADIGAGSDVTLNVNGVATTTKVNSNHEFSTQVKLSEGINKIFASIPLSGGKFSKSLPIVYTVTKDHAPVIKTSVKVSGDNVIMDAGSTVDPDGTSLSFAWAADPQNPQKVSLSGASSAITSFPLPQKQGEYYFTVTVKNSSQKTAWARTVLVVNDSGSVSPNMASWHPAWVDSAIIYSVFVRTFSNAGTFKAITERMQEIKDLGVNCIWFLPIHPTTGNLGPDNPGYAITDYMNLLQQYGTKEDFKTLVETAHQNGIKIVMDHVIQHTSDLHHFMRDAIKYKQHSPYYPFYMWDNNGNFQYLFTWVDLPSINYEEQSTRDYLLRMAKYWMQDFNIDGYRCDVAHQIIDLRPSGPAYFEKWRAELKAMKPDSYFLAEADAKGLQYLDKKFDAAYDW